MKVPAAPDYRVSIDPDWNSGLQRGFYHDNGDGSALLTQNWDLATQVDSTSGSQSLMNITLGSGGKISGTVILATPEGGQADTNGDVWVDVYSELTGAWGGNSATYSGTDTSGNAVFDFTLTGLGYATDYRLKVHAWSSSGNYPSRFYGGETDGDPDDQTGDWERATRFNVNAQISEYASIDVTLGGGTTISGSVSVTNAPEDLRGYTLYAWLEAFSDKTHQWGGMPVDTPLTFREPVRWIIFCLSIRLPTGGFRSGPTV